MNYLINFMAGGNVDSATKGAGGGAGGGLFGGTYTMLIVFALFFVVLYFFSIRPQKKREKQQKDKLSSIKKGDRVQTIGGWRGTVVSVKENTFILKLEDGARIEIVKNAIADVVIAGEQHGPGKGSNKTEASEDAPAALEANASDRADESDGKAADGSDSSASKSDSGKNGND